LQDVASIIVPTSVQFELYKWANRVKNKQEALKVIPLTTTQNEQAELITSDNHFLNLPKVIYFK